MQAFVDSCISEHRFSVCVQRGPGLVERMFDNYGEFLASALPVRSSPSADHALDIPLLLTSIVPVTVSAPLMSRS